MVFLLVNIKSISWKITYIRLISKRRDWKDIHKCNKPRREHRTGRAARFEASFASPHQFGIDLFEQVNKIILKRH